MENSVEGLAMENSVEDLAMEKIGKGGKAIHRSRVPRVKTYCIQYQNNRSALRREWKEDCMEKEESTTVNILTATQAVLDREPHVASPLSKSLVNQ